MAMSLADIQKVFKNIGKMIKADQLAVQDSTSYKSDMQKLASAAVDQATSGLAAEYDHYNSGVKPFTTNVNTLITNLNNVTTQVKSDIENYLRKVVAVDLGLAANSTTAAVGAALITDMNTASADVEPSGTGGSNDDGFAIYFASNYSIELPQDPSPNIPDSWITDTVL